MSFMRAGRPQQHSKGKRPVRPPKKAAPPKRDWVSTVNDLSVHKLSPAELSHRHEIHKSHNKVAAQWDLREKALQRRLRHVGSPAPLDNASLNIIREVFSDQLLLQDVLARSDRAMAVVKDLFGDAPRRQTGHPSVTMAPNCGPDSGLPVLQRPDPPTQLSLLSQSMMDQQALNEFEASEEDYSDEETGPTSRSEYHVIRRSNVSKMKAESLGKGKQRQKAHRPNSEQADQDNAPVTPCTSDRAPGHAALNATVAVQRFRSRRSQSEEAREEPSVLVSQVLNPEHLNQSGMTNSRPSRNRKCVPQSSQLDGSSVASLSGDQSSLGLLQAMLGQVEADLDTLSPDTAPPAAQSQKPHRAQGLTGFSVALVTTLGRLVHLLKQREEEAEEDALERRRLEEELREQRGLIDALTAETMALREEAALQAGLQQRTEELEQKLDTVVLLMGGLGLLEAPIAPPQDSHVIGPSVTACQSALVAERDPQQPSTSVYPAVLLSPSQRDEWRHIPAPLLIPMHRDLPPVDILRSREDAPSHSSSSSLTSLPLASLSSSSSLSLTSEPLSSQLSPEAMLAEITQLSRQNDRIKAQLSQAKGSGSRGSPNGSIEPRRRSSSSTGRVTPQSVGERRTSGSSSTGRRSQSVQAADGEQLTNQAAAPPLPVSRVEQRLLELNRQSAAARGRLLELIDKQKQSVSARVSPSDSPVPPSAFSPQSADGGESPESSMLLQRGGVERRSAGSELSSHSLGVETKESKTQMEKRREREGWFSLSAHVT
ncbi:spindle and centriole-associated protein 1 isoform X1 [Gymnodraco acuticeps]|uniref:Spindle and centriole-associated protein 1 n=1 Tax=Gymnodraco acuticeps TaxID=8218 RepID=A0A6P8VHP4_GYMAC|nr:spindle and centriole-associated protein 1 isoform X1 [Gymnodraco acuticeps]